MIEQQLDAIAWISADRDRALELNMTTAQPGYDDDEVATRIVKLIKDLDEWIRSMRGSLRGKKPWERALLGLLDDADRCMQILRMTEAMQKPDVVIAEAAIDLAAACRRMDLAIQGSRAESFVRSHVHGAGALATTLSQLLVHHASGASYAGRA